MSFNGAITTWIMRPIVKTVLQRIIGKQPGDMTAVREHVRLNDTALNQIKTFAHPKKGHSAEFLIAIGERRSRRARSESFRVRSVTGSRQPMRASPTTASGGCAGITRLPQIEAYAEVAPLPI